MTHRAACREPADDSAKQKKPKTRGGGGVLQTTGSVTPSSDDPSAYTRILHYSKWTPLRDARKTAVLSSRANTRQGVGRHRARPPLNQRPDGNAHLADAGSAPDYFSPPETLSRNGYAGRWRGEPAAVAIRAAQSYTRSAKTLRPGHAQPSVRPRTSKKHGATQRTLQQHRRTRRR